MWKKQKILNKELLKYFGLITQLGLSVITSILIFTFGFIYLDRKLHTESKLIIIGVILGVIAGIVAAYRLIRRFYEK
ncbi:MAG: AtpZ/AtpI family protein [Candidatus Cloacimonetes bacterium]|nr:AtpZ/AtpI family protein [Candidatus Cloacimonadota bacterium]MBL7148549.1 AtpZ/AtpI family protein [Candidatus Cloacimonadota bacterium]